MVDQDTRAFCELIQKRHKRRQWSWLGSVKKKKQVLRFINYFFFVAHGQSISSAANISTKWRNSNRREVWERLQLVYHTQNGISATNASHQHIEYHTTRNATNSSRWKQFSKKINIVCLLFKVCFILFCVQMCVKLRNFFFLWFIFFFFYLFFFFFFFFKISKNNNNHNNNNNTKKKDSVCQLPNYIL